VYLLVFHTYVNEMHGSRNKIPSKKLVRQRSAEGFNSGVKGLTAEVRVIGGKLVVTAAVLLGIWSCGM
jgi:hypothetical protein